MLDQPPSNALLRNHPRRAKRIHQQPQPQPQQQTTPVHPFQSPKKAPPLQTVQAAVACPSVPPMILPHFPSPIISDSMPPSDQNKWICLSRSQRNAAVRLLVHEDQRDLVARVAVHVGAPVAEHTFASIPAQSPVLQAIHSFVSKEKLPAPGRRKWFYIDSIDKPTAARLLVGHDLFECVIEVAFEYVVPPPPLGPENTIVWLDPQNLGNDAVWFGIPGQDLARGARISVHGGSRDQVVYITRTTKRSQTVDAHAPERVRDKDTYDEDPIKFYLIIFLTLCVSIPFSYLIYT